MVDVSPQNSSVSINVSSSGNSASIKASPDTAQYYSEKSREWAISNRIVDGVDYSSKYYAGKANESALNAQSFAQSAQDSYKQFQNSVDSTLSDIDSSVQGAIDSINTTKTSAITEINNTKTTAVNAVNTSKNQALNDIEKESSSIINFKEEVSAELENKVDLDDMVAFDMQEVTCIVESYVNGTSWYRVYSDGWCEQGGHNTKTGENTITLLKAYSSTDYTILLGTTGTASGANDYVKSRTANSFVLSLCTSAGYTCNWQACGYIA